jgi:hypothetical protein
VGPALRTGIAANPGGVTVQADWQNAFNALHRDECLAPPNSVALPCCRWWCGHTAGIGACCYRMR